MRVWQMHALMRHLRPRCVSFQDQASWALACWSHSKWMRRESTWHQGRHLFQLRLNLLALSQLLANQVIVQISRMPSRAQRYTQTAASSSRTPSTSSKLKGRRPLNYHRPSREGPSSSTKEGCRGRESRQLPPRLHLFCVGLISRLL